MEVPELIMGKIKGLKQLFFLMILSDFRSVTQFLPGFIGSSRTMKNITVSKTVYVSTHFQVSF